MAKITVATPANLFIGVVYGRHPLRKIGGITYGSLYLDM
jgi:hypothetical protein